MKWNGTRREILKSIGAVGGSSLVLSQTGTNVAASGGGFTDYVDQRSHNGYDKRNAGPNAVKEWTKAGFSQGLTLLKVIENHSDDTLYELAMSMYGANQKYSDSKYGFWSTFQTPAQGSRIAVEDGNLWEPDSSDVVGAFAENYWGKCNASTSVDMEFDKLAAVMKAAVYDATGLPSTPEAIARAITGSHKQETADLDNEFQIIFRHSCREKRLDHFGHFVRFYVEEKSGGSIPDIEITSTAEQSVLGGGGVDVDTKLNRPKDGYSDEDWDLIRQRYSLYNSGEDVEIWSKSKESKNVIEYEEIQDPRLKEFADGDSLKIKSGKINTE